MNRLEAIRSQSVAGRIIMELLGLRLRLSGSATAAMLATPDLVAFPNDEWNNRKAATGSAHAARHIALTANPANAITEGKRTTQTQPRPPPGRRCLWRHTSAVFLSQATA